MEVKFGNKIKELREELGITQLELSIKLDIERGTIAMYEIDKIKPSHEVLVKMADYFNITLDELYGREK